MLTLRRVFPLGVVLLAFILLASVADASALRQRRPQVTASLSQATTSTVLPLSSSTAAAQQLAPVPRAAAGPSNQAIFCKAFVKQCYSTALKSQSGEVMVTHSCQRNGSGAFLSFTYSCTRNGNDLTAKVLKALGWEYHIPATTTIDSRSVVTQTTGAVTTVSATRTRVITTTATTSTTSWTKVTDKETETVPTTVQSTTIIPVTLSWTTTATLTELATKTNTLTTTQTDVFIGTAEIPVQQVVVPRAEENMQRRAHSSFCLAYKIACQNECLLESSRVDDWICTGDKTTNYEYSLGCVCKDGSIQTQQVLAAIAEDEKLVSMTLLGTTTTTLTNTRTSTLATDVTSTQVVTMTSVLPMTSTLSTTTTTTRTTTEYPGVTSTVDTFTEWVFSATTKTTTTTTYVTTTTNLVLAATGYAHALDTTSGLDIGTLAQVDETSIRLWTADSNEGTPLEMMAIRSDPTGLYQLAEAGDPSTVLLLANYDGEIYAPGRPYSSLLSFNAASECGSAGSAPGPVSSTATTPCETFIFSPIALDSTAGATANTISLQPLWINPTGSTPANHTGVWASWEAHHRLVRQIVDEHGYKARYPTDIMSWFTLRFPFET